MALEIGRICVKTAGREAGRYCAVIKKVDDNFVLVTGPKPLSRVKRRRCNVLHLEPLPLKVSIKADATDADVQKAYESSKILVKLKIEKPSPEQLKRIVEQRKEKESRKEEQKKEVKEKPKDQKKEKIKEKKAEKPKKPKKGLKKKPKAEKAKKPAKKQKKK